MAKHKLHLVGGEYGKAFCGMEVSDDSTTGTRVDVTCKRCLRSLHPERKPRGKIHAFGIILASEVKSLCDRYPGYDNVTTDDADVTCKDCLKEMDPSRLGKRTYRLNKRAKEKHALQRSSREGYAVSACGFEVGWANITRESGGVTCKKCIKEMR